MFKLKGPKFEKSITFTVTKNYYGRLDKLLNKIHRKTPVPKSLF